MFCYLLYCYRYHGIDAVAYGGTDLPKCGVDETLIVMPQSFCVCHSGIIIIIQGGHLVLQVLEFFPQFSRPRKVLENGFVI